MKKINWLQIASIVAVVTLVMLSLMSLTLFLKKLPVVNMALLAHFCLTLLATLATVFYASKTQYGVGFKKENSENQNK